MEELIQLSNVEQSWEDSVQPKLFTRIPTNLVSRLVVYVFYGWVYIILLRK